MVQTILQAFSALGMFDFILWSGAETYIEILKESNEQETVRDGKCSPNVVLFATTKSVCCIGA